MASALASLANSTVTFELATAGVVTDPDTGNVMAVSENVSVTLYLKAKSMRRATYPGMDVVDTFYEGYAVEPTVLDPRIVTGTRGTLTFAGEAPLPCEVMEVRLPYGGTGLLGNVLAGSLGETIKLVARDQE